MAFLRLAFRQIGGKKLGTPTILNETPYRVRLEVKKKSTIKIKGLRRRKPDIEVHREENKATDRSNRIDPEMEKKREAGCQKNAGCLTLFRNDLSFYLDSVSHVFTKTPTLPQMFATWQYVFVVTAA